MKAGLYTLHSLNKNVISSSFYNIGELILFLFIKL